MSDDHFLSRWSRRKHAANRGEVADKPAEPKAAEAPAPAPPAANEPATPEPVEPLPPVESLTAESDFSPFMRPGTDPALKRAALKVLLRDPRFNVMDGLDVYIDDYTKPDPIPAEWMGKLSQLAHLGDYRPPEAETGQEPEKAAEAAQIEAKDAEEQTLVQREVDASSDTANIGDDGTKVLKS